jgi:hypothetical protein
MEQSYWLDRKRASGANARRATSAEARLVHYELAGRYSLKALAAASARPADSPRPELRIADAAYYGRLETGARWLASRTACAAERHEHLGMANLYARRRLDSAAERG